MRPAEALVLAFALVLSFLAAVMSSGPDLRHLVSNCLVDGLAPSSIKGFAPSAVEWGSYAVAVKPAPAPRTATVPPSLN